MSLPSQWIWWGVRGKVPDHVVELPQKQGQTKLSEILKKKKNFLKIEKLNGKVWIITRSGLEKVSVSLLLFVMAGKADAWKWD